MGNNESIPSNMSLRKDSYNRYNWVPSFIKYNEEILKYNDNEVDEEKAYHDLRPNMNCLFDDKGNLLVLSICVYLNYLILKADNLNPFIVSYDYLNYNLINLYNNDNSKNNFTNIIDLIKKIGFVSASETIFDNNELREEIYDLGKNYRYINYKKVDNNIKLVKRLMDNDKLILIGLPIYTNFESNLCVNGYINLPKENDKIIGGISGILCGYIEKKNVFIMYLGISKKCGDRGFIYLPYEYIKYNYGSELWILELNEELILLNLNEKIKKTNMIHNNDNVTLF